MSVAVDALETTVFIIMTLIMLVITIWSSILMVPKLIQKKISGLNISSLLSLLFYFLTGLFYLVHVIAKLYSNQSDLAENIRRPAGGCYMIGQWWMTLNFIKRLIFVFNHSTFKISNYTKKSLYIPFYSSLIVGAFGAVIAKIFEITIFYILAAVLWLIVHITLSITLTILFIYKIRIVTWSTRSTLPTSDKTDKNNDRITNTLVNMDLLDIAIKNGVLVPIAIISSLLSLIFSLIFSVLPQFYLLPPIFMVFDSTLTSICIFLLFASNVHIYNKLCNKCHGMCAECQSNAFKSEENMRKVSLVSTHVHDENTKSNINPVQSTKSNINPEQNTHSKDATNTKSNLTLIHQESDPIPQNKPVAILTPSKSNPY